MSAVGLLNDTLGHLEVGSPQACRNLLMLPLLGSSPQEADYLTLDQALSAGTAVVDEVSEGGSVPELLFHNTGELAVLLLDGEELVGAKQNRILNVTVLAPAQRKLKIPVSCVEAGRWERRSARFNSSDRVYYAMGRAKKTASVGAAMRLGRRHSDQGEVWEDIAEKSARLAAPSPTSAMAAMFEQHAADMDRFVAELSPAPDQIGAAFLINGSFAGLDLFDCPSTLHHLLPKLVRSYGLDALDRANAAEGPPSEEASGLTEALAALRGAETAVYPGVGEGEEVRLSGRALTGAGLVARGRLVHLAAFALNAAPSPVNPSGMAGLAQRRRAMRR